MTRISAGKGLLPVHGSQGTRSNASKNGPLSVLFDLLDVAINAKPLIRAETGSVGHDDLKVARSPIVCGFEKRVN